MSKHLMCVAALALSVIIASCATQYQSQRVAEGEADAANALQRGRAAADRQDYVTALREWRPLAQQGYAPALSNLGIMYAEGRGVARDDAEAVHLYRQAATQGYAMAQNNLGWMYEQGRGVTRDLAEAQRWYAKAAELYPSGSKRAAAIEARDRVARQLATNQAPTPMPSSVTPPAPVSVSPSPASSPITPPVSTPSHTLEPQNTAATPPTQSLDGENISLAKKGGVYQLPVEINGVITLHFVLDTGAADVNIPADVAMTLYRSGTIQDADFLPGKTYTLADGSTLNSARFLLRSLKVGRRRIPNVQASIGAICT